MYLGDPRAPEALARARGELETVGHEVLAAEAQCGQGHVLLSLGQQEEGYNVLEAGTTRVEALGSLRVPAVDSRAMLAEVAVRRGDLALARHHLKAASGRVPDRSGARGGPAPAGRGPVGAGRRPVPSALMSWHVTGWRRPSAAATSHG